MSEPSCRTCLDAKWLYAGNGEWTACPDCNPQVDKEAGRRAGDANRDRQLDRVQRGNPEARKLLREVGRRVCRMFGDVVSDDIWDHAEGIEPREKRIMGVVMLDLEREGLITPHPERRHRKAHRKVNNSRPQLIWISLVYEEVA